MNLTVSPILIIRDVHMLLSDPRRYPSVDVKRNAAADSLHKLQMPVYVADRPIGSTNFAITIERQGGEHAVATKTPSGCASTIIGIHVWGEEEAARQHVEQIELANALLKIMLTGMRRKLETAFVGDVQPVFEGIMSDVRPLDGSDNWALRISNSYRFQHTETTATTMGV